MKLYFSPDACSLSPHIVLQELGLPVELVKVDTKTKKLADGSDFLAINPKGYVPVLQTDDGQVLTEGPVIVQYLADRKPEAKLAPANGSWERVRLQETLNFITSEIHKGFSPLFNPAIPDAIKNDVFEAKLYTRFEILSKTLQNQDFLTGAHFSIADAYLFTTLRWTAFVGIDLSPWPPLVKFMERVAARPAVKAALESEAKAKKAA